MATLHTKEQALNIVRAARGAVSVHFLTCYTPTDTRCETAYRYGRCVMTCYAGDEL